MKQLEGKFQQTVPLNFTSFSTVVAVLTVGALGANSRQAKAEEQPLRFVATQPFLPEPSLLGSLAAKSPQLSAPKLAPILAISLATLPRSTKWSAKASVEETTQPRLPNAAKRSEDEPHFLKSEPQSAWGKVSLPLPSPAPSLSSSAPRLSTIALTGIGEPARSQFITPLEDFKKPSFIQAGIEPSPQSSIIPVQFQNPGGSGTSATPEASTVDLQARLDSLEQRLDKVGVSEAELDPISLVLPSTSSNVPNGYGAGKGMAAFGLGYQNRLRYTKSRDDGTTAAVIGLGDPRKLGIDVQISELDLSRFGHRTALGFKLHRQLSHDYAVALGGENAYVRPDSDSEASYYFVISKKLRLSENSSDPFSRVYLSAGLGSGRFRSESDVFFDQGSVNVFGSAAVNVNRSTTAFAEWTGQSFNIGTSFIPLRSYPFVLTLALADIAGDGGDGTRFTAGFGYVLAR